MSSEDTELVYLIDDDAAVRDSLGLLLEQARFTVQAYASAEEFLAAEPGAPAVCAVVDLMMPGMSGLELQEEMDRRGIAMPVIFLTGHGDIPTSVKAIKAGAVDFLTKPVKRAELLEAIEHAREEGERMREHARRSHTAQERVAALTPRERDVMDLAIAGLANKEIARRLNISHRTVEIHKARILRKTGIRSVVELARIVADAAEDASNRRG
jgi:FixJ family two-component response regulator